MKLKILSILCALSAVVGASAQKLPGIRINITGGYGYMLKTQVGNNSSSLLIQNDAFKNYEKRLTWASNIEGNAHYIFKNGLALGAKYRYLKAEAPATDFLVEAGAEHYGVVNLSEKNKIIFMAPSLMYVYRFGADGRFWGSGALSVGYTQLEASANIDNNSVKLWGDNVGVQADLGVDYFLTQNISLGVSTGYFYAKIKEVRVNLNEEKTKLPVNSQLDLSNIKLNLSLSIHF